MPEPMNETKISEDVLDRENYIPSYIIRLANVISRGASKVFLKLHGVGVIEWRILSVLAIEKSATAQHICDEIFLDKASASRSIKAMEKNGYIKLEPNKDDQRSYILFQTSKGMALHAKLLLIAKKREQTLLNGFSKEEKMMAILLLKRLRANLETLENADVEMIENLNQ